MTQIQVSYSEEHTNVSICPMLISTQRQRRRRSMSSSLFKFDLKIKYRSVPTCRDYGWGRFFMEAYGLAVSLAEGVGVDAGALGRG